MTPKEQFRRGVSQSSEELKDQKTAAGQIGESGQGKVQPQPATAEHSDRTGTATTTKRTRAPQHRAAGTGTTKDDAKSTRTTTSKMPETQNFAFPTRETER
jgi:hypothetical protein